MYYLHVYNKIVFLNKWEFTILKFAFHFKPKKKIEINNIEM